MAYTEIEKIKAKGWIDAYTRRGTEGLIRHSRNNNLTLSLLDVIRDYAIATSNHDAWVQIANWVSGGFFLLNKEKTGYDYIPGNTDEQHRTDYIQMFKVQVDDSENISIVQF